MTFLSDSSLVTLDPHMKNALQNQEKQTCRSSSISLIRLCVSGTQSPAGESVEFSKIKQIIKNLLKKRK